MKNFLLKLSYTVLPLWLFFIGLVLYISLYVVPNASGDLGKLGLIPFGYQYEQNLFNDTLDSIYFCNIEKREEINNIHADVLTIGDSFSQQGIIGYQNYLCRNGFTVANCDWHIYSGLSPLQYAYNLMNSNCIDSTNVKILVVEKVEREFELAVNNFSIVENINNHVKQKQASGRSKNEWSLARARDFIMYRTGIKTPVYRANLDSDFFNSDDSRKLYFISADLYHNKMDDDVKEKIIYVTDNLRKMAAQKGIRLVLLVAVDKYDLYQNHIVSNKYPKKTIMEDLKLIYGNSSDVLLTKEYLLPLIEKGEKDIFLYNDTHWSHKASMQIAKELCNRFLLLGL